MRTSDQNCGLNIRDLLAVVPDSRGPEAARITDEDGEFFRGNDLPRSSGGGSDLLEDVITAGAIFDGHRYGGSFLVTVRV